MLAAGLAVAACRALPRRIPAVHVSRVARRYLRRRRDPRGLPTLAASGSCSPVHTPTRRGRRESKGEKEERIRPWEEPSAAKTGAVRGRSRTCRRRERLLPLLPLLPRRRAAAFVFFPADEPHHHTAPTPALRPVATKVRTTASFLMWMPLPSSRGGTGSRSAPPLVMPAFVPGWDKSFAGVAAFVDARLLSLA
jgi:hypothetical protein